MKRRPGIVPGDVVTFVQDIPVATYDDVRDAAKKTYEAGRSFLALLIQNKKAARWVSLSLGGVDPEYRGGSNMVGSAVPPGDLGSTGPAWSVATCMRRRRSLADVRNREFDRTVVKDVVVGVGELDKHSVWAGRKVLDDDRNRSRPPSPTANRQR